MTYSSVSVRHPFRPALATRRPTFLATLFLLVAVLLSSCAPAAVERSFSGAAPSAPSAPARSLRPVVLGNHVEPTLLAPKALQTNGPLANTRLFNASLTLIDDKGLARPYLAESLPQLGTNSWRVTPDGRMETTYHLRDNLTWQDGVPLTADDFVFALAVYKHPTVAFFVAAPQDLIDGVLAPDARTVVVQWRTLNAGAGTLTFGDLDPLPRHLLDTLFTDFAEGRTTRETFVGSSFWTADYVGAGPYRLDKWDPGIQLEGTAFAGHVLGPAKIDRVIVRFLVDENAALATVLAGGQLDFTNANTLRFEHLPQLKQNWEADGKGTVVVVPTNGNFLVMQQRPEYVGDEALLDLRVRRALAHTVDREAVNEGLFNGLGSPTDSPVPPNVSFYAALDRIATKYPLDQSRATQLMSDAGYTRDAEGFFSSAQGRRFHLDMAVFNSAELERMQAIVSDTWRRAGFDVRPVVIPSAQFTRLETRLTLPGLAYSIFTGGELTFLTSEVGTAANHWSGNNRSGWTHPEYDRLWDAATGTLDAAERGRDVAQMMALVSEYVPGYPLYFLQGIYSWVKGLNGPDNDHQTAGFGQTSKPTTIYWNIHEWSWQ